jgi:signal transduction histidine kinase
MRFKIAGIAFAVFTLATAAFALYYNYKNAVVDYAEIRLNNTANNIIIKISQKPWLYTNHAEEFLTYGTDLAGNNLFIQLTDKTGKVLAKTKNLGEYTLPVTKDDDDTISDITLKDDSLLKTYQKLINIGNWKLGYVIVGSSSTQMYHNLDKLRDTLILVMICTVVILLLGLNVIFSLGMIQNQKKFLGFASHELRTPLAVISGNAEIALRKKRTLADYEETLKIIKNEADWMGKLVQNLLFIFRNQSQKEALTLSTFHFGELITEAASDIKKHFPTKTITIVLSENDIISADKDRIRQVINNLLENAAKYTDESGKISISLTETKDHYRLDIADNGKGIEKEQLKKIFTPFYRVSNRDKIGNGLGLTIAKQIITSHDGNILVKSAPNEGSTFTIILPKKGDH